MVCALSALGAFPGVELAGHSFGGSSAEAQTADSVPNNATGRRDMTSGWLSGRSRAEGPGFKLGDFELHPGFGAEFGYDSNVFLRENAPQDELMMRLTAHLFVSTIGPQRLAEDEEKRHRAVSFRAGVSAGYYHFFRTEARSNVETDASLSLTINPDGNYRFTIYDDFSRRIRPFSAPGDRVPTFAQDGNTAGLRFDMNSRGNVLSGSLSYENGLDYYEDAEYEAARSMSHRGLLRLGWRFFPTTSLVSESNVSFRHYLGSDTGNVTRSDSLQLGMMAGLNGAIAETFYLTAMVGYGAIYNLDDTLDDFDSITARAEIRWVPSQVFRLALGYRRGATPNYVGGYVRSDSVFTKASLLLFGSWMTDFDLSVSFDQTGQAFGSTSTGYLGNQVTRSSVRMRAGIFSEYRFTDWIAMNVTARYLNDLTDYEFEAAPGTAFIDPKAQYHRFEAMLGIRAFY